MKKLLFVCLGNICRSPMGEGVMKHLVEKKGLGAKYHIDSAGTAAYHVGELPDSRMRATAESHGIILNSYARKATASDFDEFDLVLAMDRSNYGNLEHLAISNGKSTEVLKLMREFDPIPEDMNVPDPYYGGNEGFENVFQILHRSCEALIDSLESE